MFVSPLDGKVHKTRDYVCVRVHVCVCFLVIAFLASNPVINFCMNILWKEEFSQRLLLYVKFLKKISC